MAKKPNDSDDLKALWDVYSIVYEAVKDLDENHRQRIFASVEALLGGREGDEYE